MGAPPLTARQILNILTRQDFDDWYKGDLENWVRGEKDSRSHEEILSDVAEMFDVEVD